MSPDVVLLIKLLTDIIISATATLQRINRMSNEEVRAAIREAEANTQTLLTRLKKSI